MCPHAPCNPKKCTFAPAMKKLSDFESATQFMMERLPMFSRVGTSAFKPGLDNILALCAFLGNPQEKISTVHIAGTNGKGSTSHMIAAALQYSGHKTGLYTSPHLVDIRERIRINGQMISKAFFVDFVNRCLPVVEAIAPSYFELNVAMAFTAFAESMVDIAVIEVGLGGRLDSTNIILPELSVITNISLDHTQILGDTRPKIAFEKAGIIKPHIPVIVGQKDEETAPVFLEKAQKQEAPLFFAEDLYPIHERGNIPHAQQFLIENSTRQEVYPITSDLLGNYQAMNVRTAFAACMKLHDLGWNMSPEQIAESFGHVKKLTGLRGRWDIVQDSPFTIILDVGHNPDGIKNVVAQLSTLKKEKSGHQLIVTGFVADKDVAGALKQFPKDALYFFTQAQIPRAMDYRKVSETGRALGLNGIPFPTVKEAVTAAINEARPGDTLLITGSFFIVGEAMTSGLL